MSTPQAGSASQSPFGGSSGQTTVQAASPSRAVVVTGYICAVMVPLIGFIIGATLSSRYGDSDHNPGTGIIVTAGITVLVSFVLLAATG